MTYIKATPSPNKPDEAFAAVVSLRLLADKLERKTVQKAIEQGWTWSQVAEALGITKQAAHKRLSIHTKKAKAEPTKKGEAHVQSA